MTDPADPRNPSAAPPDGEPPTGDAQAQPEQPAPAAPDAAGDADGQKAGGADTQEEVSVAEALDVATRERDTYLDHLRRERAEFENYRRRSIRERTEAIDRGAEVLISQMLGVLDNFGYVLEAAKDHDDAVAKGVRMVYTELRDVLGRAGLEDVPGVGAPFDPTWHDAVMQVEGETTHEGEPVVAQVLRTGYRFKGRVLRPASVAVTQ
jgi:molecular chaperone GrpE